MRRPQNSFEPYPNPKNSHFVPQTVKNYPKIKSKSKARIVENVEIKSSSSTLLDPKTVSDPTLTEKSELKKSWKMKVVQLHV